MARKSRFLTLQEQELWNTAMKDLDKTLPKAQQSPPVPAKPATIKTSTASRVIDLHGMTLEQAYRCSADALEQWRTWGGSVTFITGKSGAMRDEFPRWFGEWPGVRSVEETRSGGAFRATYRRKK